jgi:hypothetical protein
VCQSVPHLHLRPYAALDDSGDDVGMVSWEHSSRCRFDELELRCSALDRHIHRDCNSLVGAQEESEHRPHDRIDLRTIGDELSDLRCHMGTFSHR